MFKQSSRFLVLALVALSLVVQGCSADPTEPELSLEDLLAQFQIEMAAKDNGGNFVSAFGTNAVRSTAVFESPPTENQFKVLGPNLNVFNWPIILDVPITARWQGSTGETMILSWPDIFDRSIWPDLDVAGGTRYGNTWVVYPAGGNPNDWVAQHTEWIRRPGENGGTTFPFRVKLEANQPCGNCPIGQFIAGPSRHVTDQPEYRRRTVIKWFRYSDMSPWVWQSGGPGPGPGPTNGPVLEEVHVYVTGFRTELQGGTVIEFDEEIGDVDLMTLRGTTRKVVDADVPRGTFNDIKFDIDSSRSFVVVDGKQKQLHFQERTVTVVGPIIVGDQPITTVTVEFDLDASLSENSDGTWTLAPVLVVRVTTG